MIIKIKLFATLQNNRFEINNFECSTETTVAEIINMLNIPERDIAIIFINNKHAEFNTILKNNDTLALFPPVGGG
ncbi:MAG: MoaD/ThiS family protein [Cyanobacteriota bacterium]